MSGFGFQRSAIEQIEAPWRALDRALARWVVAHGGDDRVAAVAAWASYAESLGDTALKLDTYDPRIDMPEWSAAAIAELRSSPLVGDGQRSTPFVIDAEARFFLWRNYAHEGAIAGLLRSRLKPAPRDADAAMTDAIDTLFNADRSDAVQAQRAAVAAVVGQRLFVLTGGPGTGKTTTVLKMLLMLQQVSQQETGSGPLSIALAAPTGKAAQRLLQSLRQGRQALASQLPDSWNAALLAIPDAEAQTLHRLLGFSPQRNTYARCADDPIGADIVVVDEASMIDLAMLHALLAALRPEACLILVGDADQLTSVAAGSVLQDLVQTLEQSHSHQVVRLRHSFRAARHLLAVNEAVRQGDAPALRAALAASEGNARLHLVGEAAGLRRLSGQWADDLAEQNLRSADVNAQIDAAATAIQHPLTVLRRLLRQQVLCALREGDSGAVAIGRSIERRLRLHWGVAPERSWYPGRAVMITRNDYAAGLYNGDIGLALEGRDGQLRVWFEAHDADDAPMARGFAPTTLPEHESAFAITIHKSQGSEYDRVAVVLPAHAEHRILTRQLLYTALSRARQSVEIWGSDAAVQAALNQVAIRHGGLASRLM
jgi:exodeoxyribonuclease V alpha subunit